MCDRESFARLREENDRAILEIREQTKCNTEAIGELSRMNAVQNEQIKTLFKTTQAQGETAKEQRETQTKLVNRLVMSIIGILVIVVLALVFGALGEKGFNAVTTAAPTVITNEN